MDDLYIEELIELYKHPHNKKKLSDYDAEAREYSQTCGDDITMYIKLEGNKVKDISFDGSGCVIATSTASKLTDYAKGKSIEELEKMGVADIFKLIGIEVGPARLHCATISLEALQEAIKKAKESRKA
ncbi:MAG: iron-sulfur cluster assembly scaffold protein [Candidatus Micrarchaeota archaeon]